MAARILGSKVQNSKLLQIIKPFKEINNNRIFPMRPCIYRISRRKDLSITLGANSSYYKFHRWLSTESSEKRGENKKDSSVFNELMESKDQPQTQLTVGAKGLSDFSADMS